MGFRVASAYESLGQLDDADRSYRRAKSSDPRLVAAFDNHGNVLKQLGAAPEALHSFRTGINLEPARAQTWYNYGTALQEMQRWAEALAAYDETIDIEPSAYGDDPSILANRGLSLLNLDQAKDGEESLRRAVQLQPNLMEHPAIREVLHDSA
eukprot:COSAG02_NODE_329_length_24516_cov_11.403448_11_plen_153_part_00